MERRFVSLHPEGLGLIAYGHYGRALLAFPSEQGYSHDYESMGMVDAIADLIEAGRVKLHCVDAIDGQTWLDKSLPLEERARRHGAYEKRITGAVAQFIAEDCGGAADIAVTGPSFGAHHAANFALKRGSLPAGDLPQRHLRRVGGRLGRSRRRRTSTTPPTTCATCTGSISNGCAAT